METKVMAKSILILWVMNSLIWQSVEGGQGPNVSAMFIFGDSLADAGTNNFIPNCTARSDFTPYGISAFLNPTGRFTNGYTVFDFIATQLNLPLIPPYRELPLLLQDQQRMINYSNGINFASGGSGLLDSTGLAKGVVKLSDQISKFEEFSRNMSENSFLGNSLYCISSGGNDIDAYFSSEEYLNTNITQFVTSLVDTHDQYIQRLHRAGAKNFLLFDISLVGCTPYARVTYYSVYRGGCAELGNTAAQEYNVAFKNLVDNLNEKLEEVHIILLNSFDFLGTMINNGQDFGFSETKAACCGSGMLNANVTCGKTSPTDQYCDDPDTHLFWDAIHPTQEVYSKFSKQIWEGNSSFMHPFNLSTLIVEMNRT